MAATERELQLYREQAEDDQKRNFFSLIAHAPARYDEVQQLRPTNLTRWLPKWRRAPVLLAERVRHLR